MGMPGSSLLMYMAVWTWRKSQLSCTCGKIIELLRWISCFRRRHKILQREGGSKKSQEYDANILAIKDWLVRAISPMICFCNSKD